MLAGLFRFDSPFWQAVGRLGDIVLLNIAFVVFSLPLVTMGAAMTAVHDTARRMIDGDGTSALRLFTRSFVANVRGATLLWIWWGPLGLAIVALFVFVRIPGLLALFIPIAVVYVAVSIYVWAAEARFANSPWGTVRTSFLLAFGRLPLTLAIALVDAVIVAIGVGTFLTFPQGLPIVCLFGYALVVFANTPLIERVFRPYVGRSPQGDRD